MYPCGFIREIYINKVISEIPKEKYENIFKGSYERPRNITRKYTNNYL